MTRGRPREYELAQAVDPEVERAMHRLVDAALGQPRPSRVLVRRLNAVLTLVGHPLRDRSLDCLEEDAA